jgi:hypothetical protein
MTGRRLALLALVAAGLIGPARAELVCPEAVHMAGRVKSGQSLSHTFTLANRGGAVIELLEVKPGCGCLRPEVAKVVLQPGEQAPLTAHVNTVTQPGGTNNWKTTVRYREAGAARELELTLRAEVIPEVSIQPANLLLHVSGPMTAHFKLLDRRDQPFQATRLVCASEHVRAKLSPPRREGEAWERTVTLEVLAGCPEGRHDDVLRVITTDPDYPELKVPFTVIKRVPGKVQASPASVEMTATRGQPLPAKIVLMGTSDNQDVRAGKVETSHRAVRCSYAAGPGSRLTLRIEIDHLELIGDVFEAEVKVHLSGPKPETVTIPVRVRR